MKLINNRKKPNRKASYSSNELAYRVLKKKIYKLKKSIFILLAVVCLTSFSFLSSQRTYNSYGPIIEKRTHELTPFNVFMLLERYKVKHADIVVKQSILETGWYKCEHCSLKSNNIFGFRYKKKYLKFDNWTESVEYYKKWQEKRYKGGDYYAFLKNVGYATSKTYISKLKSIKLKF